MKIQVYMRGWDVCGMQVPASCCESRLEAATEGHYNCYKLLTPYGPENFPYFQFFPLLRRSLLNKHVEMARRLVSEQGLDCEEFARYCLAYDDTTSLGFVVHALSGLSLTRLAGSAALRESVKCLHLLLETGALWDPYYLLFPTDRNHLDVLEVVLQHSREWCPKVRTLATCIGRTRFLMRIFEAGCPTWASAVDDEPRGDAGPWGIPARALWERNGPSRLDWCLLVSSDLVVSGPVLLYAAQKGAPLTPRMEGMLGEVRRRALALAGCFHQAARLARRPGLHARKWAAMGRVPPEIVERIATLARTSIRAVDLVE